MPWIIVAVVSIGLLVFASGKARASGGSGRGSLPPPSTPESLAAQVVRELELGPVPSERIRAAIDDAIRSGLHETARALMEQYEIQLAIETRLAGFQKPPPVELPDEETPAPEASEAKPEPAPAPSSFDLDSIRSPVQGISDETWRRFERTFRNAPLANISSGWNLGMYYSGARRLEDLGYMTNVRKEGAVYKGDFAPPHTLEEYLSSPGLQYETFERDMTQHLPHVQSMYGQWIGKQAEGKPITLSGLLALAKMAGLKGAGQWLSDPEKGRYPNTTSMFKRATGIF